MLDYIYHILRSFRKLFSRRTTWIYFCVVILGFIGASNMDGVSSFCCFWHLQTPGYLALLHLFRSSAWNLKDLLNYWENFVLSQNQTIKVNGRAVLIGDHTIVPKDGRRMPGVVTIHQDSETQSKPQYFRGHYWGAISLLVGTLAESFALPLNLRIHQGFAHLRKDGTTDQTPETMITRLVQMAIVFAVNQNIPCILVLDAFFSVASVFNLAASVWSVAIKKPMVSIIVRSKKNYVAYFSVKQPEFRRPGRPLVYGDKVKLYEVFDHLYLFEKATLRVYGKNEQVSFMVSNLLWKTTGTLIRFVFALTSRGPIVLMCSDLEMSPLTAIELYCSRVRIETLFSMLKHLIGAFQYHFWSKRLPLHSRKPKKNQKLKSPTQENLPNVQNCWECYERFVALAAIASGLLQLIALKFPNDVWAQSNLFLRTRSRSIPSEKTVKSVITQMLIKDFLNVAPSPTMQEILVHFLMDQDYVEDSKMSVEKESARIGD